MSATRDDVAEMTSDARPGTHDARSDQPLAGFVTGELAPQGAGGRQYIDHSIQR